MSRTKLAATEAAAVDNRVPNPKRVAAGRLNWAKRRGFTQAGLERLRAAALARKPWLNSTGPRTATGKARSAQNWRFRKLKQPEPADLLAADDLIRQLAAARRELATPA